MTDTKSVPEGNYQIARGTKNLSMAFKAIEGKRMEYTDANTGEHVHIYDITSAGYSIQVIAKDKKSMRRAVQFIEDSMEDNGGHWTPPTGFKIVEVNSFAAGQDHDAMTFLVVVQSGL